MKKIYLESSLFKYLQIRPDVFIAKPASLSLGKPFKCFVGILLFASILLHGSLKAQTNSTETYSVVFATGGIDTAFYYYNAPSCLCPPFTCPECPFSPPAAVTFNTATTNSFTFTVPCGVTSITVEAYGAGGGGGGFVDGLTVGDLGTAFGGGGGGGGGACDISNFTVTPGTTYNISLGLGGAASDEHCDGWSIATDCSANGGVGGTTTFSTQGGTVLVSALGGGAGNGASHGAGGSGVGGTYNVGYFDGGCGSDGVEICFGVHIGGGGGCEGDGTCLGVCIHDYGGGGGGGASDEYTGSTWCFQYGYGSEGQTTAGGVDFFEDGGAGGDGVSSTFTGFGSEGHTGDAPGGGAGGGTQGGLGADGGMVITFTQNLAAPPTITDALGNNALSICQGATSVSGNTIAWGNNPTGLTSGYSSVSVYAVATDGSIETSGTTYTISPCSYNPDLGCWTVSGLNPITDLNATVYATVTPGTTAISGTSLGGDTCASPASNPLVINVDPLTVSLNVGAGATTATSTSFTLCNGLNAYLLSTVNESGPMIYAWSSGGLTNVENQGNVSPTATTTYTVTAIDGAGCAASSNAVTVTVVAAPVITAGPTANSVSPTLKLCAGVPITVAVTATQGSGSALTASSYAWAGANNFDPGYNNSFPTLSGSSNSVTPTANDVYTVTITNSNTCSVTGSVAVTLIPQPTVTTTGTATAVCFSSSAQTTVLPYQGETNGPNSFSIAWNAAAIAAGFSSPQTGSYTFSSSGGNLPGIVIPASLAVGTYNGTLTVSNPSPTCSNSYPLSVTVNTQPSVTISPSTQSLCSGSTSLSSLTANPTNGGSSPSYMWSSNGSSGLSPTTGPSVSISPVPTVNTIYTVTITNATGGCTATASSTVTVNPLPTITSTGVAASGCFSASSQTTSMPYTATTNSPTTYTIHWSSGISDQSSTTPSPPFTSGSGSMSGVIIPASLAAGVYTGTVTISNGTCTNTQSISLTINAAPVVAPTATPSAICTGGSSTLAANATAGNGGTITGYSWSSGGPGSSSGGSVSPTSTTVYTVDVTNSSSCSTTASVTVTVGAALSPSIALSPTSGQVDFGCGSNLVTLTASPSGYTYTWGINAANGTGATYRNLGSPNGVSTNFNPDAPPLMSGTVTVEVTVTNGLCSGTATANVIVEPELVASPSAGGGIADAGCSNTISLTGSSTGGSGGNTYNWGINSFGTTGGSGTGYIGSTNSQNTTFNQNASPALSAGTVQLELTVTDAIGCTAPATVNVVVQPALTVSPMGGTSETGCIQTSTNLQLSGNPAGGTMAYATYAWSIVSSGGTGATSANFSPSASIVNPYFISTGLLSGTVTVGFSVTDAAGCIASGNTTVIVHAPPTATVTSPDISICLGFTDTIKVALTGTPPWNLNLTDGNGNYYDIPDTITQSPFLLPVSPTVSSTYVVDTAGDQYCSNAGGLFGHTTVTVIAVAQATVSITPSSPNICPNGSTTFNFATGGGGTPYLYKIEWDSLGNWVSVDNGTTHANVTYAVTYYSGTPLIPQSMAVTASGLASGSALGTDSLYIFRYDVGFNGTTCNSDTAVLAYDTLVVVPQPFINPIPDTTVVCDNGAAGTLTMTVTGGLGTTYQWYDSSAGTWSAVATNQPFGYPLTYGGATTNTLTITAGNEPSVPLYYKVGLSFSSGCSLPPSPNIPVDVAVFSSTLKIESQPPYLNKCNGSTFTLPVGAANGTTAEFYPLSFQWQYTTDTTTTWSNVVNGTPAGVTYSYFDINATTNASTIYQFDNIPTYHDTGSLIISTTNLTTPAGTYFYRCIVNTEGISCNPLNTHAAVVIVSPYPSITTTGAMAPVCFSGSAQTTTLPYTATTGIPDSFSIVWSGSPLLSPNQGSTYNVFSSGSSNMSGVSIPASTAAGTYDGTLTVTTAVGCATGGYPVFATVSGLPTITTPAAAAPVCASTSAQNSSLTYSATTNTPTDYTINWNSLAHIVGLQDVTGTNALPASPITVPIAANVPSGTYTGTLNLTNVNSCASSPGNTFTVTVNTASVAPSTISASPSSGCVGTPIQLTANGTLGTGANYQWGTGSTVGTNPISGATTSPYTPSPLSTTTYWVEITNTSPPCAATTGGVSQSITINSLPTISAGTASVCIGSNITLTGGAPGTPGTAPSWSSSPTGVVTVPSTSTPAGVITGVAAGTTTVYYTNNNGCKVSAAVTVNALPTLPSANVVSNPPGPVNFCTTSFLTLTATVPGTDIGPFTYAWSGLSNLGSNTTPGMVSSSINSDPALAQPTATGTMTYTVTLTDANTCTVSNSVQVKVTKVQASSVATLSVSSNPVCPGTTITLSGTTTQGTGATVAGMVYAWYSSPTDVTLNASGSGQGTLTPSTTATPGTSLIGSETYTITVTDSHGCSSTASTSVTVNAIPTLTSVTTSPATVCAGASATITLNGILNVAQTISYTMGGTSGTQTASVTGSGGTGTFSTIALTTANSAQTITITGMTRADGVTPHCSFTPASGNTATLPTVNPVPAVSNLTVPSATALCAGNTSMVTINSTSLVTGVYIVTYNLSAPNAGTGTGAMNFTSGSPGSGTFTTSMLSSSGSTTLTVTSIAFNSTSCSSTVSNPTTTITVNPIPTLTGTSASTTPVCNGVGTATITLSGILNGAQSVSYNIGSIAQSPVPVTGSSNSGTFSTPVLTFANSGQTVTITGITASGCTFTPTANNTATLPTVDPLPTLTGGSAQVCVGSTITLSGSPSPATTGTWTSSITGDATVTGTNSTSGVVSGVAAGAPIITYTNSNGCQNSLVVTVNPLPVVTLSASPSALCVSATTSLTAAATGGSGTYINYTWSSGSTGNGLGVSSTQNNSATPTPPASGTTITYNVSVTDDNSCSSSVAGSTNVTVKVTPVSFTPTVATNPVCTGASANVQITSSQNSPDVMSYQLQTSSGGSVGGPVNGSGSTINLPTANLTATTTYQVQATDPNSGCIYTTPANVSVLPINPDISLGNEITGAHYTFGTGSGALPGSGWVNIDNGNPNPANAWIFSNTGGSGSSSYSYYSGANNTVTNPTTGGYYIHTPTSAINNSPVILQSAPISTAGYSNISIIWAAQKSAGYTGTVSLSYSTSNGGPLTALSFTDVQADVTGNPWSLVNNGVPIKLNVDANNITYLQFLLTANGATDNSYYSINDIVVYGLPTISNCGQAQSPLPFINSINTNCDVDYGITSVSWPSSPAFVPVPSTTTLPVSPIEVNIPAGTATGTYNLAITVNDAASPTPHSSAAISFPVTVKPTVTVLPYLDNCVCMQVGALNHIVSVFASGGTSPYTFAPVNTGDVLSSVIDASGAAYPGSGGAAGAKGIFSSKADGLSHTYQAMDASGCPAVTSPAIAITGITPTTIPMASNLAYCNTLAVGTTDPGNSSYCGPFGGATIVGPALPCHQTPDFANTWVTYVINNPFNTSDPLDNTAVVEINNYGHNLDSVAVSLFREPSLPSVTDASTACYGTVQDALQRHFVIQSTQSVDVANSFNNLTTPTNYPNNTVSQKYVGVRLYFTDAELTALEGAVYPPSQCTQTVTSISNLYVTKYTGTAGTENGLYTDNLQTPSGIYRVMGPAGARDGQFTNIDGSGGAALLTGGIGSTLHFVELNVTEFSEFWLHGSNDNSPLPVQITYIQADAVDNTYIQVTWGTDLEINNNHFVVERSLDEHTWDSIGSVPGHDNSTVTNNYSFNDLFVVPNIVYYYRLKQVDNNGNYTFTSQVSAEITGKVSFSVEGFIPNPTTGGTRLLVTSSVSREITIDLYDVLGRKVLSEPYQVNAGVTELDFDFTRLAAGTYSAIITTANEIYAKKVVIAK